MITGTLTGKIRSFLVYASPDGKACLAVAEISTTSYRPNYPLGLKPGDSIGLLAPDQTICALLGQSKIAKLEIQFRVVLPPLTLQPLPNLQEDFPTNQRLYRVVLVAS
jgi:hypothetical protein